MLGQIYKDFCITKFNRSIWMFFGISTIYSLIVYGAMSDATSDEMFFFKVFQLMMIVILLCNANNVVIGTIKKDDDTNWQQLAVSMPGGIRDYMRAKYVEAGINMSCGLIATYIYVFINNILWSEMKMSLYIPLIIIAVLNVFLAFDLIFSCYYGVKRGTYIKGIIVFCILMIPLIYGLFGNISWVKDVDINSIIAWYVKNLDMFDVISGVAFAVSVSLIVMSYMIGIRLVRRKK